MATPGKSLTHKQLSTTHSLEKCGVIRCIYFI